MIVIFVSAAALRADTCVRQIDVSAHTDTGIQSVPDDLVRDVQSQRSAERFVCVEDQGRIRHFFDTGTDLLQGVLYAAVTVHLIAEQVGDNNRLRMDQRNDLFESGFVTFQNGIVCLRPAAPGGITDQICSDALQKIGSGLVEQAFVACGFDRMLDHVAGGRLAVRTGYNDDLHSGRDYFRDLRRNLHGDLAGDGSTSASCLTKDGTDHFAGCNGRC